MPLEAQHFGQKNARNFSFRNEFLNGLLQIAQAALGQGNHAAFVPDHDLHLQKWPKMLMM